MKKRKKFPLYAKLLIAAFVALLAAYAVSKCGYWIIELP